MKIPAAPLPALALLVALAARAPSAGLPEQRSEAVFGQRIAYYEEGSGPTVVLLHGLAVNAALDWGACIGPIAAHHHVLAPDQLGFGASDKPVIDYGIQTWVDMLGEFLRLKKVTEFTLVGESLGGWIGANYTVQALGASPAAGASFALPPPRRLILVDAAGHRALAEQLSSGAMAASIGGSKALLSAIYYEPSRHSESETRRKFESILSKGDGWTVHSVMSNRGLAREAVDDKLPDIRVPTLVVWGDSDRIIPISDGRDFAAKIPGARLVVIAKSGHAPADERPTEFLDAVLPFIDQR